MEDLILQLENLFNDVKTFLKEAPHCDVTVGELVSLETVCNLIRDNSRDVAMGEVAAALRLKKPSVTQLFDRMEKKGLIERYVPSYDRRKTLVKLTDKGRRMQRAKETCHRKNMQRMVEILGEDDVSELLRIMHKYFAVINDKE